METQAIRLLVDIRTQMITGTKRQYKIKDLYIQELNGKKYYICKTSVGNIRIDFIKVKQLVTDIKLNDILK